MDAMINDLSKVVGIKQAAKLAGVSVGTIRAYRIKYMQGQEQPFEWRRHPMLTGRVLITRKSVLAYKEARERGEIRAGRPRSKSE